MTAGLIILDRDGVINQDSDAFIKSPDEWIPVDGSLEAIAKLNSAGYRVVVATNQSGLARGLFNIDTLNRIHNKMHHMLSDFGGHIEGVFFCPHGPDDNCECRKPKPGLLVDLENRLKVSVQNVPVIGDSLRDLQAAIAVGATPVLVRTGKGAKTIRHPELPKNVEIFNDLADFTSSFL